MGARQPPKAEKSSRIFIKMFFVALLVFGAGVAIWTTASNDRISLIERENIIDLRLDPAVLSTVNGRTLYIAERTTGGRPVILLHDIDVAGSVTFDGVIEAIGGDLSVVTIDLPGFGLSHRTPEPGAPHTVAQMARDLAAVLEDRFDGPVVIAGVGLGGEVASEIAATRGELVSGLVLVDVDFWANEGWRERSQRLPFIGNAMTFRHEGLGRAGLEIWAPYCSKGGWCPSAEQTARRSITASLAGTTESINSFRRTPRASFVPDDLDLITVPTVYVWSSKGPVPRSSVDRLGNAIGSMAVVDVDVFQAHLESPGRVADAIAQVAG